MNYSLHPKAEEDLRDAAEFYRERAGKSLSQSLLAEFEHIFAHGHLSAHANKCQPETVNEICDITFRFHMKVMDDEFSKIVCGYKATI